MGRNRGQGGSGGGGQQSKQSKKECKAVGRSHRGGRAEYTKGRNNANRKRNLLREARRAEKKLEKLLKRSWEQKPGGITPGSRREQALSCHIGELKAQAKSIW